MFSVTLTNLLSHILLLYFMYGSLQYVGCSDLRIHHRTLLVLNLDFETILLHSLDSNLYLTRRHTLTLCACTGESCTCTDTSDTDPLDQRPATSLYMCWILFQDGGTGAEKCLRVLGWTVLCTKLSQVPPPFFSRWETLCHIVSPNLQPEVRLPTYSRPEACYLEKRMSSPKSFWLKQNHIISIGHSAERLKRYHCNQASSQMLPDSPSMWFYTYCRVFLRPRPQDCCEPSHRTC